MTRRPDRLGPLLKVHQFNQRHKRGDRVLYRAAPTAAPVEDTLFCEAEILHGHHAVAWLAGQIHPVPISTISPCPEESSHAH